MLTVNEFCEMFTDPSFQKIAIYDIDSNTIVWKGFTSEVPKKYQDLNVESIDTLFKSRDTITLNVNIE